MLRKKSTALLAEIAFPISVTVPGFLISMQSSKRFFGGYFDPFSKYFNERNTCRWNPVAPLGLTYILKPLVH